MIVRFSKPGRSFKGLGLYLTHDPKASTSKRVTWTHSLNCAHDDQMSVVHEMYTTFLDAGALKAESGVRAGGRPVEKPVRHFSLSWHPDDRPDQAHMIETTEAFLRHMGWQDHQALLVAHNDTEHRHVHVMLNAIHPETGLTLNDDFAKRRAQEWALEYERSQDNIRCEQRLLDEEQRQKEMSREAWEQTKANEPHQRAEQERREYDADYMKRRDSLEVMRGEEWKILKEHQRLEREAFFEDGKAAYAELRQAVYREVREEFREDWATYYAARREHGDSDELKAAKEDILARQSAAFKEQRDEATVELRGTRDARYADLLKEHRNERADLRAAQDEGMTSPGLLNHVHAIIERQSPLQNAEVRSQDGQTVQQPWREAGGEVFDPGARQSFDPNFSPESERDEVVADPATIGPKTRDPVDGGLAVGMGLIGGVADLSEKLLDGFLGGGAPAKPAPRPLRIEPEFPKDNPFKRSAEAAQQQVVEQEEKRSRDYWEDRERSRD